MLAWPACFLLMPRDVLVTVYGGLISSLEAVVTLGTRGLLGDDPVDQRVRLAPRSCEDGSQWFPPGS